MGTVWAHLSGAGEAVERDAGSRGAGGIRERRRCFDKQRSSTGGACREKGSNRLVQRWIRSWGGGETTAVAISRGEESGRRVRRHPAGV
ncbi:hypothetical protein E2562_025288 [Oryza meyeriana var. granulata]|uniref:Uncharacterized protein n=1 Tax=Oryza meyeriana var. granulata TaxID=110450 RepID=A0A6G1BNV1_9ORYZ|nr:hypothetical protein E2562_025288 [Oryza meyeriana var. granulata]